MKNESVKWNESVGEWLAENSINLVCAGAILVGVVVCSIGATNWNDYCVPRQPPIVTPADTQATVDAKWADYTRRIDDAGKHAVLPWVWCMPLTFGGLTLVVMGVFTLIARNP